jgi:hypothetical protein
VRLNSNENSRRIARVQDGKTLIAMVNGRIRVSEVILGVATGVKTIIIGIYVFHERRESVEGGGGGEGDYMKRFSGRFYVKRDRNQ